MGLVTARVGGRCCPGRRWVAHRMSQSSCLGHQCRIIEGHRDPVAPLDSGLTEGAASCCAGNCDVEHRNRAALEAFRGCAGSCSELHSVDRGLLRRAGGGSEVRNTRINARRVREQQRRAQQRGVGPPCHAASAVRRRAKTSGVGSCTQRASPRRSSSNAASRGLIYPHDPRDGPLAKAIVSQADHDSVAYER